jgi:bifunctional DNA-binding transcriptional regulator/antitoxin component of YhaV-PrlF toxin-antitoxin module
MSKRQKNLPRVEFDVTIRKRNQITLPNQAVELLGVGEGDRLIIALEHGSASLRPVHRSYAGIAKGVYGDAGIYAERERSEWE